MYVYFEGGDRLNEFSTYEFVVVQKTEGKWILAKAGLLFLYISVGIAAVLLGIIYRLIAPMIAFLPVLLWMLVFFTWRYTCVEYECSFTSGELTFAKIYGNRSRRTVLRLRLRDAVRIAPLDNGDHSRKAADWHPELEFSAISTDTAPDIYYILFEHGEQKEARRAIFYFEATARALQICRFYNPSATILTQTTR